MKPHSREYSCTLWYRNSLVVFASKGTRHYQKFHYRKWKAEQNYDCDFWNINNFHWGSQNLYCSHHSMCLTTSFILLKFIKKKSCYIFHEQHTYVGRKWQRVSRNYFMNFVELHQSHKQEIKNIIKFHRRK